MTPTTYLALAALGVVLLYKSGRLDGFLGRATAPPPAVTPPVAPAPAPAAAQALAAYHYATDVEARDIALRRDTEAIVKAKAAGISFAPQALPPPAP